MLQRLRHYFALGDLQLKLYILATLTGILAGAVIIAFRLLIEQSQVALLPSGQMDDFASLSWYWILLMPILGGLLVGLLFNDLDAKQRSIGVIHVIERLAYHQGRFPVANAIRQFIGSIIALASGHSVGREGPSVHLGATSGSFIAMHLDLPNNGVRLLVASGAAAAIAASFNTPIAGVIFAMEVIMMEYHIATFIPIILASLSGAVLSRLAFGESPFFGVVA
jgi:H+/Cl- antiporter ClcA